VWEALDIDPWLVRTLKEGYRLEFSSLPPLTTEPVTFPLPRDQVKREAMVELLEVLLQKGVVEVVAKPSTPGFYSRFFVTPKKDSGKWRAILDLSALNHYICNQKFKMETAESIRASFLKGDWATSIDLQDAYFHVPIHHTHQKYLRFAIGEDIFQFVALPMGAKPSGQVFTRVVTPVKGIAHQVGIELSQYLDDWIIKGRSKDEVDRQTRFIMWLTEAMGFLVNHSKSEMIPAQKLIYLGYSFLLDTGNVLPTEDRWQKLQRIITPFLQEGAMSARSWLQLIGLLTSTERLVFHGMLHIRPIQFALQGQWKMSRDKMSTMVEVTDEAREAARWWTVRENVMAGVPLTVSTGETVQVFTDASMKGWGGHLNWKTVGGEWSTEERTKHINVLELMAVVRTLQHFVEQVEGRKVLLSTDNSTTVAYIRRQGGVRSRELYQQTVVLYDFIDQHNIELTAKHIPGRLNILADRLSRDGEVLATEWSLNPRITEALWELWDRPLVDLFATRYNNKLPTFVSPIPDERALDTDAMNISWVGLWAYAFPPTALLNKVMDKFRKEGCELILVAPFWPNQAWFSILLDFLIEVPRELPTIRKMLKQPQSTIFHRQPEVYNLHAWRLSGSDWKRRDFLSRLRRESRPQSSPPRLKYMRASGGDSVIGVRGGVSIPRSALYLK